MGPSDMFGELSILDSSPRTTSATTITDVHAVSMDRDAMRAWITDRPEIAAQLLRMLTRRVRHTNDRIADAGRDCLSGRGIARIGQQGARRFRPTRLDQAGRQKRRDSQL
jgi:CRP/FNR family cyclic AMP-dependent transcriptional regulator